MENIISDKLNAAHEFKGGNTRMKDYDDLWRISEKKVKLDQTLLKKILSKRKIKPSLETEWINKSMQESWKKYQKRYKDMPPSLEKVFKDFNSWISEFLK